MAVSSSDRSPIRPRDGPSKPTIVRFDDGEMLVTFDIAEADVALDYRTYATHSTDAGATWTAPGRVVPDPAGRPTTQSVRTTACPTAPWSRWAP